MSPVMSLADNTDQRCSRWAGLGEVTGAAKPLDHQLHQLHLCGALFLRLKYLVTGSMALPVLCAQLALSHTLVTPASKGLLQSPGHSCKAYGRTRYASATE